MPSDKRSVRDIALETYESMRPEGKSPRGKKQGPDTVQPEPEEKPAPAKKAAPKKSSAPAEKPADRFALGETETAQAGEAEGPDTTESSVMLYEPGQGKPEWLEHLTRTPSRWSKAMDDMASQETIRDSAARHWTEAEQLENIYANVPSVMDVRRLMLALEEASVSERPKIEQKLRDIQSNAQLARQKYVDLNVQKVDPAVYTARRDNDAAFDRRFGMEPSLETLSDDRLERMKRRDVGNEFGESGRIPDRLLSPQDNAARVLRMVQMALKTEDQRPGDRVRDWGTQASVEEPRPKEREQ
jgi:hypothetical protein